MKNLFVTNTLLITLCFITTVPELVFAKDFCISNQQDLLSALNETAANHENDSLRIVQGAELQDVVLPKEIGFLITIKGSYDLECIKRIENAEDLMVEPKRTQTMEDIDPQQSTLGPFPPEGTESKTEALPVDIFSGGAEVTVLGVTGYAWHHGCGPTAVGMVVGYWDENGFDDLFFGSATTQTTEVNQGIASEGDDFSPRHYEDFSSPEDSSPNLLTDKSESAEDERHTSDSIADFMHTSWSSDRNYYGWSWSSYITRAFADYVQLRNSSYVTATAPYWYSSTLTWSILTNEIDAQRPMVFLVDSDGNASTDHFVTVVGYKTDSSIQYYGCLDTWYPYDVVRWEPFQKMSSSYSWGVWGGFSFQVSLPASYTLTYTTGSNGSIIGTSPQTVLSGEDGSAVTAVPDDGYEFVQWSDGSTSNPRTDTNVTSDISVTASFAAKDSSKFPWTLLYPAIIKGHQ
jgi:hypothetical protein